ncbi:hypothetical protein Pelo_2951 [Pelomyxa schiedti]|nr:hypothetical protein Pelo_2951 [Pelomyxa schiedti]
MYNALPHCQANRHLDFCPKHPRKQKDLFCVDDNCLVCASCAFSKHRGHSCVPIEDYTQQGVSKIPPAMDQVTRTLEEIRTAMTVVEDTERSINKKFQMFEDDVKVARAQLIEQVTFRTETLLEESLSVKAYKVRRLEEQKKLLTVVLSQMQELHQAGTVNLQAKPPDPLKLLDSYQSLLSISKETQGSLPLVPVESDNITQSIDITTIEKAVKTMGIVSCGKAITPPTQQHPKVLLKLWGAAGGSGDNHTEYLVAGTGGFTEAEFSVPSGTELSIMVGQGGESGHHAGTTSRYGGGGPGGDNGSYNGCSGGGGTFVFTGESLESGEVLAAAVVFGGQLMWMLSWLLL